MHFLELGRAAYTLISHTLATNWSTATEIDTTQFCTAQTYEALQIAWLR